MIVLFEKTILFLACFLHLLLFEDLDICVFISLIGIITACLSSYTYNNRLSAGLCLLYCGIIFFYPVYIYMLPLISYDCLKREHNLYQKILCLAVNILAFIYAIPYLNSLHLVIIGFLILIANMFSVITNENQKLKYTISKNRDDSRELQLLLEQKNADLIEKSNYEIEMATLRERNRIAREIHDNVGHLLTRSILQVGALNTINKDSNLAPHYDSLSSTLNQAMNTIRTSVHNLYNPQQNLKASLETFLQTVQNLEIQLTFEAQKVPQSVTFHVISIVKEAINNTLKHSNANRVHVSFLEHPRFYQLTIEDNGSSVTSGTVISASSGMGLSSIQERITSLRGTMEIFTDNGFKIFMTIMKETK